MRIAHVVPRGEQPWSGILTVIVDLSGALRARGHQVEVWRLHDWPSERYARQRGLLEAFGVSEVPVATDDPWWKVGRAVRAAAEERDIDVIHLHGAFNVWNTMVSRAILRPFVFSPHSGYEPVSLRRSRVRKAVYARLFERRMLSRAALLVALTETELSHLRAFGDHGPTEVIPNGVRPPPLDVDPLAFRTAVGLTQGTPLAVFVGRLDVHRKGLDRLVRGMAGAPAWHLALVGPRFRGMGRLEATIRDLAIGERVHVVGERYGAALHEVLAAADVFVMLSRWEGLPMALLEALSHGTPAVVSAAVEHLVAVEAAGAGLVADEHDLPAILERFRSARADEAGRWREAARILARQYEWGSVARRYGEAYERAVRSVPTGGRERDRE